MKAYKYFNLNVKNINFYKFTFNQLKFTYSLYNIYMLYKIKKENNLNLFRYYISNTKNNINKFKIFLNKKSIIHFSYSFFFKKKTITKMYNHNFEFNFLKESNFNKLNDILKRNYVLAYKNYIIKDYVLIEKYDLKLWYDYNNIIDDPIKDLISKKKNKLIKLTDEEYENFLNSIIVNYKIYSDFYMNFYNLSKLNLNLKYIYFNFFYNLQNNFIFVNYKRNWNETNMKYNNLSVNIINNIPYKYFFEIKNKNLIIIYNNNIINFSLNLKYFDKYEFFFNTIFHSKTDSEPNNLKKLLIVDQNDDDKTKIPILIYNLDYILYKIIKIILLKKKLIFNDIKYSF